MHYLGIILPLIILSPLIKNIQLFSISTPADRAGISFLVNSLIVTMYKYFWQYTYTNTKVHTILHVYMYMCIRCGTCYRNGGLLSLGLVCVFVACCDELVCFFSPCFFTLVRSFYKVNTIVYRYNYYVHIRVHMYY